MDFMNAWVQFCFSVEDAPGSVVAFPDGDVRQVVAADANRFGPEASVETIISVNPDAPLYPGARHSCTPWE